MAFDFYIWKTIQLALEDILYLLGRWFVKIPANIKNLKTNCVISRLMSILFSFQSRIFIKLNKSKH